MMSKVWTRDSAPARVMLALCAVFAGHFGIGTAIAEPRALLVGIGDYPILAQGAKLDPNLPGIDLDIANMRQVTSIMGFQPTQVRVLFNADATYSRVVHELSTWVRDGVRPEDPVVIYFSGHGTRIPDMNGDEADGKDEVLIMNDTGRVRTKNSVTLDKVLVDDKLGELLARIPSQHILVLVDACHSGTATREIEIDDRRLGESRVFPKFYHYGDSLSASNGVDKDSERDVDGGSANYVSLSAAKDTQVAVATFKGGLFTLGLLEAIKKSAAEKRNPTLTQVRNDVDAYIARSIDPERRHNPVVTGDTALAEGGIPLVPLEDGNGPTWAALEDLSKKGQPLTVSSSRPSYKIGEEVSISVDVPMDGFLNIVTVDSKDRATVLYPNKFSTENNVKKGTIRIPSADMKFVLPAQDPLGPTLVVAFLTQAPLNLRDLGIEGRDASGRLTQTFTDLSAMGTRGIGIEARKEQFHAGKLSVVVTPAASL